MTIEEKDLKLLNEAVEALRVEVEKSVPDLEKMEKINATLDALEEKNQVVTKEVQTLKNAEREHNETLTLLEGELARSNNVIKNINYKETAEYKALTIFCQVGHVGLGAEHKDVLRTDNDVQGGFLVPTELDNVIIKKITEISPVRSIARVRTTSGKTMELPVRATIPLAEYEGETETGTDSTSTYENETTTPFRLTFSTGITQDQLMDAAFNMDSEIVTDAQEAFAFTEGNKFVLGTGFKQPEGFTVDSRVQAAARETTTIGQIDSADYLLVAGDLKTGYNPVYVLNRRTLADLRTKTATTGEFIWQPGLNGVVSNTIGGSPYILANDMPDIASGAFPVAFGDFFRGYTIIDRTGMRIIRDELTLKKKAIVEFTMWRYNFGKVTLPEAIKLLKVKA